MFAFWERVIRPLIGSGEVVEVGVYGGDVTRRLLAETDCAVHAIDPSPAEAFDLDELLEEYGHRFVFHKDTSLDALPLIERIDVALLDGDHNWYTVHSELQHLGEREPFPLTFVHDIDWPYGRRDLYYAPERIPDKFRHPHKVGGMLPDQSALVEGGFNAVGDHALHEGGPRNGIRTAVEDFLSDYPDLHFEEVSGFHGLGVISPDPLNLDMPDWLRDQARAIEDARIWTEIQLADTRRELRATKRALRQHHGSGAMT